VRWSTARQLEITVQTRTLQGELQEHVGDDLTVIEIYKPSDPNAFPSYRR
jgi:hypothetical protein